MQTIFNTQKLKSTEDRLDTSIKMKGEEWRKRKMRKDVLLLCLWMLVALQTRDKVRIRVVNGLLVVKRLTEAARSRHHTPATCLSRHAVSPALQTCSHVWRSSDWRVQLRSLLLPAVCKSHYFYDFHTLTLTVACISTFSLGLGKVKIGRLLWDLESKKFRKL